MEAKSKTHRKTASQKGNGKFREFFIDQLKDIYWAEQALLKALPKMAKEIGRAACRERVFRAV